MEAAQLPYNLYVSPISQGESETVGVSGLSWVDHTKVAVIIGRRRMVIDSRFRIIQHYKV